MEEGLKLDAEEKDAQDPTGLRSHIGNSISPSSPDRFGYEALNRTGTLALHNSFSKMD